MRSLYFYLAHEAPVLRYSSSIPRIGDTVSLPELGGNLATLKVFDVVWEFGDDPHVNVLVHQSPVQKKTTTYAMARTYRNDLPMN